MSKQANPAVIGGFVLGAATLFIVAILFFSSGVLYRERLSLMTYFPGSIQGLSVGAQVQFQGVQVGKVTAIRVDYLPKQESFKIPVKYEIWVESINVLEEMSETAPDQVLRNLVDTKGLRARLETISFVTGQYVVVLSLNPGMRPPQRPSLGTGEMIEVPALEATRDRIAEMLLNLRLDDLVASVTLTLDALRRLLESQDLHSAISNLDKTLVEGKDLLSSIALKLEPLVEQFGTTLLEIASLSKTLRTRVDTVAGNLEATSDQLRTLAQAIDAEVEPIAAAAADALRETGRAMRSVRGFVGQESPTRSQLNRVLQEATHAARALRMLAEYLERHPEALLQGKR